MTDPAETATPTDPAPTRRTLSIPTMAALVGPTAVIATTALFVAAAVKLPPFQSD
jgi:hypothetical protein